MKILLKRLLIVIGILFCIGGSIFYGIPLGSDVVKTEIVGRKGSDVTVVAKTVHNHRLFPLSVEGLFYRTYFSYIDYYERNGPQETKLPFLSRSHYEHEVLKPFTALKKTNKWVAFRLKNVEREKVDIFMHVFDNKGLYQTFEISDAIRISTCAEEWEKADSYSISQPNSNETVLINTYRGLVSYDQDAQRLIAR
jgi:hypothetical protein